MTEPPLNLDHGFTVSVYFPPGSDPAWVSAFLDRVAEDAYSMPSDTLDAFVVGHARDMLGVDADEQELAYPEALELVDELGQQAYRAEDRLAFVREMCDLADREQRQVTTEQVRAWTKYVGCANATPDGASLAKSLSFAMAAKQPGHEPVFCHHEHRTVRWRTTGGVTTITATCTACPARAESTEGEPVLAPYLLNAERCTDACTEQHTYRNGCLMAPDFSKPILRSEP